MKIFNVIRYNLQLKRVERLTNILVTLHNTSTRRAYENVGEHLIKATEVLAKLAED